jgi:hypothetical protein
MQSVELLRQPFPAKRETLDELAAIADRIERLAETADLGGSARPPAGQTGQPDRERATREPGARRAARQIEPDG